jgi:hypothetical protein
MKYIQIIINGLFLILLGNFAYAENTPELGNKGQLFIYPAPEGWQAANVADVQKAAISAASTLMRHFPEKQLNPIIL